MNYFFSWLQKPYPLPETRGSQFKMAVLLSMVVALFIFVFRPFNQHENTQQALTTALIGGATVFVTIYFHFLVLFPLFPRFFREERWTIARELFWTLIVIISIAMSNMALIAIWGGFPVTWRNIGLIIVDTTIIGVAPATASILINQSRLLRRYRRQALALNEVVHRSGSAAVTEGEQASSEMAAISTLTAEGAKRMALETYETANPTIDKQETSKMDGAAIPAAEGHKPGMPGQVPGLEQTPGPPTGPKQADYHKEQLDYSLAASNTTILLTAETGKERVVVAPSDLLAISSADNYCKVYLRDAGRVRSVILRSPLKRLEGMLAEYAHFWRCHRTAIVNLESISGVGGTAQGYRLEIAGLEETIPVSRTLNTQLREKLGAGIEK